VLISLAKSNVKWEIVAHTKCTHLRVRACSWGYKKPAGRATVILGTASRNPEALHGIKNLGVVVYVQDSDSKFSWVHYFYAALSTAFSEVDFNEKFFV